MSTEEMLIVLLVLAVLAAGAWYLLKTRRRQRLSGRFGPEYERTVATVGSRATAERVLEEREQRVAQLDIQPVPAAERTRHLEEWRRVQARFVDEPREAVAEADRLIGEVMQQRGYPVGDFDRRSEDLSVEHPVVVQHYRAGHELAVRSRDGRANTEDLRQTMVHYRALFTELLEDRPRQDPGNRAPRLRKRSEKEVEVERQD